MGLLSWLFRRPAPRRSIAEEIVKDWRHPDSREFLSRAEFLAIDVETANGKRDSICQIGIAAFRRGDVYFADEIFVNPQCEFLPWNIELHGITAAHCVGAPTFSEIYPWLRDVTNGQFMAAHSSFDVQALRAACKKASLPELECSDWIDTVKVAQRLWPDLESYALPTVAAQLGMNVKHHSALADAAAAGGIVVTMLEKHGLSPLELVMDLAFDPPPPTDATPRKYPKPPPALRPRSSQSVSRDGRPGGPLNGQVVVLTGEFLRPKPEIADMLQAAGADVRSTVTDYTTILLMGSGGPRSLPKGATVSSKHAKAIALYEDGQDIDFVHEADLADFIAQSATKDI